MGLIGSAIMKLTHQPAMVAQFTGTFGYAEGLLPVLAALELASVVLYLIPGTAVLGAVITTGYLGGAIATHVRVSDPAFMAPLTLGVLTWAGLFLRDERVRALLPIRRAA
jgi:hypothetical protein